MKVRTGFKYVVDESEYFEFPDWFPLQYRFPYDDARINVSRRGLTLKQGFAWNGANAYPDYDWIMVPSAIHDAMLWWRHYHWKDHLIVDLIVDREMKRAIDRWFADLAKERMPNWRRWLTPTGLFFGVNVLSKLAPGPDQAEAHKVVEYT